MPDPTAEPGDVMVFTLPKTQSGTYIITGLSKYKIQVIPKEFVTRKVPVGRFFSENYASASDSTEFISVNDVDAVNIGSAGGAHGASGPYSFSAKKTDGTSIKWTTEELDPPYFFKLLEPVGGRRYRRTIKKLRRKMRNKSMRHDNSRS